MEAGQDLGDAVVIQADAADQELLVYLTHHWAGASRLMLGHGGGHLEPRTTKALNLQRKRRREIFFCHECHFQAGECSANWTQQGPGTTANKAG